MWTRLFQGQVTWEPLVGAALATVLIAWLAAWAVRRLATAALRAILSDTVAESSPLVRGPLRLLGLGTFVLLSALLLFPAFELAGLQPETGVALESLVAWVFGAGLRVALIVIVAYALVRATGLLVARFEYELTKGTGVDALERAKRARTLGSVVSKAATVVIFVVALLMALDQFDVNVAPVLTGAGIAGLAVGFGAQTLVRDIISGFFLILENQVRVGDVAAINGTGGLVEQINLRTIVLRDLEGTVHVFPNGAINTLANRSKEFAFAVLDIGISFRDDPDRVVAVLREIGAELQQDPHFGPSILEPLEVLGVDAFGDWAVKLKVRIKTIPLKQWEIGREFRRRIRYAFERHGIEFPFPERVITMREGAVAGRERPRQ